MIDETTIEQQIADLIAARGQAFAARGLGVEWFRSVLSVGMIDVDIEDVGDYAKNPPACIIEVAGDVAEDLGSAAESSRLTVEVYVYVFVTGSKTPADTARRINALSREVKDALRGAEFGSGTGVSKLLYRGSTPRTGVGNKSLMVKMHKYELRTLDHPLT